MKAVADAQDGGTYNYVVFSADDVEIQNQPAFMRQNGAWRTARGKALPPPDTSLKQGRPDAGMQERPTVRAVSGSLGNLHSLVAGPGAMRMIHLFAWLTYSATVLASST